MKKNKNIYFYHVTFGTSQKPLKDKDVCFATDCDSTWSVCWWPRETRKSGEDLGKTTLALTLSRAHAPPTRLCSMCDFKGSPYAHRGEREKHSESRGARFKLLSLLSNTNFFA